MLTASDLRALATRGIDADDARRQLELLRHPPPPLRLLRPCTIGDGVRRLPERDHPRLLEAHAHAAAAGRFAKLVPASGAATRMFRTLQALRAALAAGESPPPHVAADGDRFFASLDRLPPADGLAGETSALDEPLWRLRLLERLLGKDGLDLTNRPKALIPFHRTSDGACTPFEEQLFESAYLRDFQGRSRVCFTVSAQHQGEFTALLERRRAAIEAVAGSLEVSFSTQHPSTDTLAVDLAGHPVREADGTLHLRPGGHGALLANLENLGGDLVYVKNIDNVLPAERRDVVLLWKRLLGGLLAELQQRVFAALEALDDRSVPASVIEQAIELAGEIGSAGIVDLGEVRDEALRRRLRSALDRPLRVCGVVENAGEPGGGPFWVETADGERPQIVESAQIDPSDAGQQEIRAAASHFNPVDLVCAVRDRRGRPYPLARFVDPQAVFVARKSRNGEPLLALERPGLWNGGMAFWNTVFVEVPASTFAPVKTLFDLLRPEHQSG